MGICCTVQGAQTGAPWQPRGVDGMGGGREGQERGRHITPMADHTDVWQKSIQYCKAIILQLKKKKKLSQESWVSSLRSSFLSIEDTYKVLDL